MEHTEEFIQHMRERELGPNDTFQFDCAMCGKCCRKRSEPILMTGADIFRIAQTFNSSVEEILPKNFEGYVSSDFHVPVYVLAERLDGSCRLMRNGRCMVQQNKPVVCAIYPLGRFFEVADDSFHYFMNRGVVCPGRQGNRVWTLNEWLDEFHIRESEEMTAVWHKLVAKVATVSARMKKENIRGGLLERLRYLLYLGYDINAPYIEQVEARIPTALDVFKNK